MACMSAFPLQRDVEYPESDGQPMAETDLHRDEMYDLIEGLALRYLNVPDVYVSGNLFFYYVQGDPRAVVAPDVFLVRGVPKRKRRIYKLWEEGRVPSLVIEVTSDSTKEEDFDKKKSVYRRLGVEEYFLHDPYENYLSPPLQGYRLVNGRYQPLSPRPDGSLRSRITGLDLHVEGEKLRLVDAATKKPLPWGEELTAALNRETAARELAEERASRAEERANLEAAAREQAEERANWAEERASRAEHRANREAAARQSLEEELNRLRREVEEKERSE
jgi:Uma2 family endonuclease